MFLKTICPSKTVCIKFTLTIVLMVLLTKADPGGQLAEGSSVWVVAVSVKQFKAYINEGLQHGHPSLGAWLCLLLLGQPAGRPGLCPSLLAGRWRWEKTGQTISSGHSRVMSQDIHSGCVELQTSKKWKCDPFTAFMLQEAQTSELHIYNSIVVKVNVLQL